MWDLVGDRCPVSVSYMIKRVSRSLTQSVNCKLSSCIRQSSAQLIETMSVTEPSRGHRPLIHGRRSSVLQRCLHDCFIRSRQNSICAREFAYATKPEQYAIDVQAYVRSSSSSRNGGLRARESRSTILCDCLVFIIVPFSHYPMHFGSGVVCRLEDKKESCSSS